MDESPIKIIFIGKSGVGKTILLKSFIYKDSDSKYDPTVISQKDHTFHRGEKKFNVRFFDLAGQEDYIYMYNVFIEEANVALLCCEKGNMEALYEIENLFIPILEQKKPQVKKFFIITKNDLGMQIHRDREYTAKELSMVNLQQFDEAVDKLCKEKNIPKRITSSKTQEGVDELLDEILIGKSNLDDSQRNNICYFCC